MLPYLAPKEQRGRILDTVIKTETVYADEATEKKSFGFLADFGSEIVGS